MSARQKLKELRDNEREANFFKAGNARTVDGIVYATRKEARMARANKKLLNMETTHGREEADSSAP